jgi:uncharacterized protein YoxC
MIAFPKTKADRIASGDPRLSVEERYPSLAAYMSQVTRAVDDLVAKRLMLKEDVNANVARLQQAARATGVLK